MWLDNFKGPFFDIAVSSVWSRLMIIHSIAVFISFVVFFSSWIFIWFFSMISISLLNFTFCLCVIFLILLNCLSVIRAGFLHVLTSCLQKLDFTVIRNLHRELGKGLGRDVGGVHGAMRVPVCQLGWSAGEWSLAVWGQTPDIVIRIHVPLICPIFSPSCCSPSYSLTSSCVTHDLVLWVREERNGPRWQYSAQLECSLKCSCFSLWEKLQAEGCSPGSNLYCL